MKELKCPKCGSAITVDETDYAAILQQVKTAEFDAELAERIAEMRRSEELSKQVALQQKESEIAALKLKLQGKDGEARAMLLEKQAEITKIKSESEAVVKAAQEQVEFYKNMKAKLSTKMIGESLEVHCSTLFNQTLRSMLPNAYFD